MHSLWTVGTPMKALLRTVRRLAGIPIHEISGQAELNSDTSRFTYGLSREIDRFNIPRRCYECDNCLLMHQESWLQPDFRSASMQFLYQWL